MRREELLADQQEDLILQTQSLQSKIWTAIPAIIQEIDYSKFTISALPSIQGKIEDENGEITDVDLPVLVDIPLVFPRGGKWHLTTPIQIGDEVLVLFSCRCIDAWWQNGGIQPALEKRMHDLSDAIAIPAPYSQPEAQQHTGGFSQDSIIIRDDAKENFLEFKDSGDVNFLHQANLDWDTLGNADVYIKGNCTVNIDGNAVVNVKGTLDATIDGDTTLVCKSNVTSTINGTLNSTIDGDVTLTCKSNVTASIQGNLSADVSGNITVTAQTVSLTANNVTVDSPQTTFTGNVSIGGNLSGGGGARSGGGGNATFTGNINASGVITGQSNVIGGGISLKSHTHSGVESGPGNTGGPQ